MDAESVQKTLKLSNFTTTYAILMKLTIDTDVNKVFLQAKSWGISQGGRWRKQKTLKMS